MKRNGLIIHQLVFTGENKPTSELEFKSGLNLLYGASNSGKSFALKAIDFMFGGNDALPPITEKQGYTLIYLGLELINKEKITLCRALDGGDFKVFKGLWHPEIDSASFTILAGRQQQGENLSQYLLKYFDRTEKKILSKVTGTKVNFSFRHFVKVSIADETGIMDDKSSPVLSGDILLAVPEKRSFNLVMTGIDDGHLIFAEPAKTFKASNASKTQILEEMVSDIEDTLSLVYNEPPASIRDQFSKVSATLELSHKDYEKINRTIDGLLADKQDVSNQISHTGQRIEELSIHLSRFRVLDQVYLSDIERLESLEEAGYMISLEEKACGLCGAGPQHQAIASIDVESLRTSAYAEIRKVSVLRKDLALAVADLTEEFNDKSRSYTDLKSHLAKLDERLNTYSPVISKNRQTIKELMVNRDNLSNAINLIEQKDSLVVKIELLKKLKRPSKKDGPVLDFPDIVAHDFCKVIEDVLKAWHFPGDCKVSFDKKNYDIIIDGKLRTANGKGVRAITHAAFKVAILIYCYEKELPHPGFLILDSPMLTYRDPMKSDKFKNDKLTEEERELVELDVKSYFFNHLASISNLGQFIVLENVDPPGNIHEIAHVQTFYGKHGDGRNGLF